MKELNNSAKDPLNGFSLSSEDLNYLDDPFVIGTFHTHPGGGCNLSVSDYYAFINYPRLTHYICGKDGVKSFIVRKGTLVEK